MQSAYSPKSELDFSLLQEFLCEHFYDNADYLYDSEPDELIESCFRQYYVFLFNSFPLAEFYSRFRRDAYRLFALRGLTADQCEYRLRSSRFINYVQALLNTLQNEKKIDVPTSPARESGEDLAHVVA